jgi:hypothetical protein
MAEGSYNANPFAKNGRFRSRVAGINASLNSSRLGRAFTAGSAEALGFEIHKGNKIGSFLGIRESMAEIRAGKAASGKGMMKLAGKTAWKSLPLAGTAFMAYFGYKENGVMGAVGGVGESMLWGAGLKMAGSLITNPLTLGIAGVAAVGAGGYALGEAGQRHQKRLTDTEFASQGAIDALSSVGAATNRQRSMMALNNTHLNGRMAIGNEGILMHGTSTTGLRRF